MTMKRLGRALPAAVMALCLILGQAGVFAADIDVGAGKARAETVQTGGRKLKPRSELKAEKPDKPEETGKPEEAEKSDRPEKPDKPDKPQNPGKSDKKPEKPDSHLSTTIDDANIPVDWATGEGDFPARFVELENQIRSGQSSAKIAYLTFDDGPYALTDQYLATLAQYNVRATFFVIGKPAQTARYQAIAQDGHALGNHTYSHGIFTGLYSSPASFIQQVDLLESYLYGITGIRTNFVRFPGGSPTAGGYKPEIVQLLRERGYGYVDWSAYSGDGFSAPLDAETAYQTVIRTVGNQQIAVVLMHDYSAATAEALPRIIETLRAKGYLLLPLTYESCMINK